MPKCVVLQEELARERSVRVQGNGGRTIERFIVADVARSYAEAAAFTQRWIDGQA